MDRLIPTALALAACVALVVLQANVPWAHVKQGSGSAYAERTVTTWQDQGSMKFGGFSNGQSKGWFEGNWDDSEQAAVAKFRVAAPLLVGAALLLLVGGLLVLTVRGPVAAILTLLGAVAAIVATVLYSIASQDLLGGQQSWLSGFYIAIAACACGLVGGTLAFLPLSRPVED
jgi:hypothetical protein